MPVGEDVRAGALGEEVAHRVRVDGPVDERQVAPDLVEDDGRSQRRGLHGVAVQRRDGIHGQVHTPIVTRGAPPTLDTRQGPEGAS